MQINPIHSDLARSSDVTLGIYNLMGQEVVRLLEGALGAGRHKVHWDGKNAVGELMVSGVYLYRIEAGEFHDSKKLILSR